ncbi:uncharacterized protein [Solanum tuberosum]|uniref:Bromodomain-containing protein n=3 Tax=Solanum tuberosum TaxID=4113 RepID=M1C0L0_SOLTU|nr:PREDICTED: uncharacterized protein LOC102606294 [Solanum tuberosum]
MGQIVKTKKKGRPSKADLARRNAAVEQSESASAKQERELRRSGRRRNVRYAFDIDDYLDDDEYFVEDDEDERGREKKLKHLLKLQSDEIGAESTPSRTRRVSVGPATSASSSDDGDGRKPSKKRRINGDDDRDEDEEDNDDEIEIENENDDEARGRNEEAKDVDSAPGTPSEPNSGMPLPDKKTMELILDKLQKKDIYGVYAEPVDPEELPDYHEVIDNPMDFTTVRNKLRTGSYVTLEQLESDIFLICSNAMQYNSSDTVYHKQARTIQELATKKFEKLRIKHVRSEKDVKLEQKTKYGSVVRKQIKKPMVQMFQETVGSDFSSGATLAAAGDNHYLNNTSLAGVSVKPYGVDGLAEGNSSLIDQNVDKAEESLSGKGPLSRFGRKSTVPDENRRGSYNISTQPVGNMDSIFSTFEDESKHLVTVGLYSDHAYARSLTRFAATLGPVAWRVASQKIEQALPPGFKFGHGWVGEYEPLPTPVLVLENYTLKEPPFFSKSVHTFGAQKNEKTSEDAIAPKDKPLSRPMLEGKSPYLGSAKGKSMESGLNVLIPTKEQSPREVNLEGRSSFLSSGKKPAVCASPRYQHPDLRSRNFNEPDKKIHFKSEPEKKINFKTEPDKKLQKQVELNCPPSASPRNSEITRKSNVTVTSETPGSRSTGVSPRNPFSSGSFKQSAKNGTAVGGMANGRAVNNNPDTTPAAHLTADKVPTVRKVAGFFHQEQEQGLSDPVQLMRMLSEKAQNQQNSLSQSLTDASPISPVTPSVRKDDSGNAAATAARAWMSVGAGGFRQGMETASLQNSHISADSLYNPSRNVQQQTSRVRGEHPASAMHFQAENSSPLHAFVPHPARVGSEAQFQNPQMIFRQSIPADLSRFQVQSAWQGFNQPAQPRQKQDSLPPDLNISFQSSGSPGRPSSTVLVDSQQPDLALQL